MVDPSVENPYRERLDPILAKFRSDRLLPIMTESKIEQAEPRRVVPYMLSEDPNLENPLTENAEPSWTVDAADMPISNSVFCLTDNMPPRRVNARSEQPLPA
jgi:hypothetical protein